MTDIKRTAIWCDCLAIDHMLVMEVSEWDFENFKDKELLIYYQMTHFRGFFNRLWMAFKYIFKFDIFGNIHYTDMIVRRPEDLQKMRDMIDEVLEFQRSNNSKNSLATSEESGNIE